MLAIRFRSGETNTTRLVVLEQSQGMGVTVIVDFTFVLSVQFFFPDGDDQATYALNIKLSPSSQYSVSFGTGADGALYLSERNAW